VYEPTEAHVGATLEETRALARLVEDLRTLSLAEAGQLPLSWEAVDVAELLADVGTSFGGQAEAAGIALHVEVEGDPAALRITADVGRLDQVLSNLLANALRHTPSGGAITLRAEPAEGGVALCATRGRGSLPRICSTSLTAFGAAIGRAPTPAGPGVGWGWRSRGSWCRPTGGASGWKVKWAGGRRFPSSCRWEAEEAQISVLASVLAV